MNNTYIIHYKEPGKSWSRTSYTTPDEVTDDFLIDFFGLDDCEDYRIEKKQVSGSKEPDVIRIGTKVTYRANSGRGLVRAAHVTKIDLCEPGEKYGEEVQEIEFGMKDDCTFDLDDGHWCYGDQISSVL